MKASLTRLLLVSASAVFLINQSASAMHNDELTSVASPIVRIKQPDEKNVREALRKLCSFPQEERVNEYRDVYLHSIPVANDWLVYFSLLSSDYAKNGKLNEDDTIELREGSTVRCGVGTTLICDYQVKDKSGKILGELVAVRMMQATDHPLNGRIKFSHPVYGEHTFSYQYGWGFDPNSKDFLLTSDAMFRVGKEHNLFESESSIELAVKRKTEELGSEYRCKVLWESK